MDTQGCRPMWAIMSKRSRCVQVARCIPATRGADRKVVIRCMKHWRRLRSYQKILWGIASIAIAVGVFVACSNFLPWTLFIMNSPTMAPILPGSGELVLVRTAIRPTNIRRDTLVLVDIPTKEGGVVRTIRRVAAVAGEMIPGRIADSPSPNDRVPQGHCFVLACRGIDSTEFGPLGITNIIGVVIATWYRW